VTAPDIDDGIGPLRIRNDPAQHGCHLGLEQLGGLLASSALDPDIARV
jgi:hypothetical protein